jgi:hypothetical protein
VLLASPVAGRLATTAGARVPLVLGAALSAAGFVCLAVAHAQPWEIYVANAIFGLGVGFAFASMGSALPTEGGFTIACTVAAGALALAAGAALVVPRVAGARPAVAAPASI